MEEKDIESFFCDGISNGRVRCVEQCAYCVKKELNSDTIGLGDVIEKITEATGIKKVVEKIAPKGCGCGGRKQFFNKVQIKK